MFTPSVRLEGPQLGWGARRAQTARYLKGAAVRCELAPHQQLLLMVAAQEGIVKLDL